MFRDFTFEDEELEAEYLSYTIMSRQSLLHGLTLFWGIIYPIMWLGSVVSQSVAEAQNDDQSRHLLEDVQSSMHNAGRLKMGYIFENPWLLGTKMLVRFFLIIIYALIYHTNFEFDECQEEEVPKVGNKPSTNDNHLSIHDLVGTGSPDR